jgi:hypothetical protein
MQNKVNLYEGATSALTLPAGIASLASSTVGVGVQTTFIDLTSIADNNPQFVTIQYKIKLGTSPTGSKGVYFYALWSDGTHFDGAAGAVAAAFTVPANIPIVWTAANAASPSTGDVLQGSFTMPVLNKQLAIAVVHDTVAALNATAGNHYLQIVPLKPDIQAAA